MRVCSISSGVVHAIPRTMAMAKHLGEVHFVDLAGTADRTELERGGVRYHGPLSANLRLPPVLSMQRLLGRISPDVICVHYGLGDHFFGAIAYGKCPVAVIAMGTDVLNRLGDAYVSPMRRLLGQMAFRRSAYVSAKSRVLAAELGRVGVRSTMDVNYWGASLERFMPGDKLFARRKVGLPEGPRVILSARAMEPLRNIHLIVEAFPAVLRRWPDSLLVLVGRSQREYRATLESLIDELGIRSNVRLIGEVNEESLPAFYCSSDVMVSVAGSEGFPNTLLESMACRVPVLVGDLPQIRELLRDGVDADLCEISRAGIESGLLALLDEPLRAGSLAESARGIALRSGDIDRNGEQFARRVRELAASRWTAPGWSTLKFRLAFFAYIAARALWKRVPGGSAGR